MKTRVPQKSNSIEKKNRLAETCYYLICEYGLEAVSSSMICDRAKVSVGTFYAYFKDKEEIVFDAITKFSKPILFPIYDNINKISPNPKFVPVIVKRLLNISLENHTLTKKAHQNIMSTIYSNENLFNIYKEYSENELEKLTKLFIENNFKEENLKKNLYTSLSLIESFVHEKIFYPKDFIDYKKQEKDLINYLTNLLESNT